MFFPYNTDAPLYHRPLATGGLIALNCLVFVVTFVQAMESGDPSAILPWMLELGHGFHPLQWLTCLFLHADFMHLVGNMFGLWTFGLIVEGKVGWRQFLAIYLGTGIVGSLIFQLVGLGISGGHALGASGAIFALLAIALVWAPENDIHFWGILGFYTFTFELTAWAVGVLYIGLQLLFAALSGDIISSEGIHLIGACLGLAVGIVMVRRQWVDCEYWDIFSVWAGTHQMSREERAALERQTRPPTAEERTREQATCQKRIREVLAQDQPALALAAHRKMSATCPEWRLPEDLLRLLVAGCLKQGMNGDAIRLMREYLEQYREFAAVMRLKLAEVLLRQERRPAQALRVLAKIAVANLTDKQRQYQQQLVRHAQTMLDQGIFEPEVEDW